jgi:NAD(P)-dependent dehydrogenase (short-subunit alcohol dehydrogenase family)
MITFRDKVIFITGGTDGIGLALAAAFAKSGAHLAVCARNEQRAQETASTLGASGARAIGLRCDVRNRMDVERSVDRIRAQFGRIDILINNAGVAGAAESESLAEDEWDRIVDTNLKGVFLCSQAVGRHMLEQRAGAIVNVASVAGLSAFPKRAAYGASKAGVVMLTKVLAVEWADRGVRVNAIAPGVIRTPLNEEMIAKGNLDLAAINRRTPMGRRGETDDMVGAVTFLASDAAAYVTGAVLTVDGGWSAYGFL